MAVAVTCNSCHRISRLPESTLGTTVRCPYCYDSFLAEVAPVPLPEPVAVPAPEAPPISSPEPVAEHFDDVMPVPSTVAVPPVARAVEVPSVQATPVTSGKRFPPIRFVILITRDPQHLLKGRLSGEVSSDGLTLSRTDGTVETRIPIGSATRYLGLNRLAIVLDGREVQMLVFKANANQDRLTRDLAAFLNRQRPTLRPHDYSRVWYVVVAALLPLVLPVIAWPLRLISGPGGGIFWGGLAVTLTAIGLVLALGSRRHPGVRFLLVSGLDAAGALLLLSAFLLGMSAPAPIPRSGWQAFNLANDPYRGGVTLPPGPIRSEQRRLGKQTYAVWMVDLPQSRASFSIGAVDLKGTGLPLASADEVFDERKQSIQRELPDYRLIRESSRPLGATHPGRRLDYRHTGGRPSKYLTVQLYLVRKRLYLLAVSGEDLGADPSPSSEFLDSFRVVAQAEPRSPTDLPGLLVYFPFDEGGGNVATDHAARQVPLTRVGWSRGVRGDAVQFQGRGSRLDYDRLPNLNFARGDPFSFAGWFRSNAVHGVLFSHRRRDDPNTMLRVSISESVLQVEFKPAGGQNTTLVGGVVNDGRWHHFAVTRSADDELLFYQDGVIQGRTAGNAAMGSLVSDLRCLGCDPLDSQIGALDRRETFSFRGTIDDYCIFSRALSAEEVAGLAVLPVGAAP
jgi:hypothetical protein